MGEDLLGKALKGRRHDVVIVTKGGTYWDPQANTLVRDSSKAFLRKGLEESLGRLGTDYVDLFLIHWPDESRPFQEPMEAFQDFKEEGKIRYGGVSNFSVPQMEECLEHFPIVCNQVGYSLFDRRMEEEVLSFCLKHGIGVMSHGSLAYGLLTGAMTPDTKFDDDDWRSRGVAFGLPLFEQEHFAKNLATVEKLKKLAAAHDRTVAQLAVAWVISNPTLTVALTGIRNSREIEENVVAAEWKLTEKEKEGIEAAFRLT